ncbi:hypothetical protein GCM10011344_15100 [Dokdonia pacifica]|uniref:AAA domain-containing protein, putative AbiEii toxin, Type IV TA system n=1 Tax=Dokdonia pacifica TaxID=1627892 RepID=A0A238W2K2_9FLAO|nr:AAA family ATPase [Dokdonia pacifica]GGG15514.1 hypothetical protein GCM10011344_15100 [Dokdonia pacifica]SNR40790.1 AAA domain-containing protein, putative AbiEii toxin, Type IV TA system [Dokdonia pacifica]
MNFFVVSAGKPGSDYIESNFKDIIDSSEFALHPNTTQKGTYFSIEKGDVLILKYKQHFVAYGVVIEQYENPKKKFSLRTIVDEWVYYDMDNPREGVTRYGIQNATIGGGRYGTVKTVRPNFGLDKIRLINDAHPSFDLIYYRLEEISSNLEKDGDYFDLHEELFNFLLDKSDEDPEFTFVIRDSNNRSNLDKGYWFYGEETVAISFWTGMDHIHKRPVISFLINPNRHCRLIIQTDIYKSLKNFLNINNVLQQKLDVEQQESLFIKKYDNFQFTDYINCLGAFLKTDYHSINNLLEEFQRTTITQKDRLSGDMIIKFPEEEFNNRLNNLFRYRQNNNNLPELTLYSIEDEGKADYLQEISIKNFGLIKEENINVGNAKWVFITGENGSGKTMLLRTIGTALGNRTLSPKEIRSKIFEVNATLITQGREISFNRYQNENVRAKRAVVSRGLAMYGPYRLEQTSNLINEETFRKSLSKVGSFASLFENGAKLLSFDKQLELWTKNANKKTRNHKIVESRIRRIMSLLPEIIPDLRKVQYEQKSRNKFDVKYLIRSEGSDELMTLRWDELSSGNKNILNLVSDIIIRLFHQQPKEIDPSELRGIVLIDEIDLHLHPKAQKDLIVTLSETFPLLQFIVTTHSPIPLLGAPKNSAVFVVKRDWERGVYTQRVDDKIYLEELLPNTILTSPIFGMDDITNDNREKGALIRTENTFAEVEFVDKLENKIKEFITDEKEKALIERFENKRK